MAEEKKVKPGSQTIITILLTIIVTGLVVAGSGFIFGWPWQENLSSFHQLRLKMDVQKEPQYFSMDDLVVNLVSGNGGVSRFLKARPIIMTTDDDVLELLSEQKPKLRSEMIGLLRKQDPQDMLSVDGFDKIRNQMLELVRRVIGSDQYQASIHDLYFTDFVVQ